MASSPRPSTSSPAADTPKAKKAPEPEATHGAVAWAVIGVFRVLGLVLVSAAALTVVYVAVAATVLALDRGGLIRGLDAGFLDLVVGMLLLAAASAR
jgi:hypothetical protein